MTDFTTFGFAETLLRAVETAGFTTPTPIQNAAIPPLLDGRDVLGVAQTGTGKTAAFVLPLLNRLAERRQRLGKGEVGALILAPTRELAVQIDRVIADLGRHTNVKSAVVCGGVPFGPQIRALNGGPDVLVATPGRLLDLLAQGHLKLNKVKILVLDEADRLFDMGFVKPVRTIAAETDSQRQTVMFSATMPKAVAALADALLTEPTRVDIAPETTTTERVAQRVLFVDKADKPALLIDLLRATPRPKRVIVFVRTKHGADRLVKRLGKTDLLAEAVHGNRSQAQRQRSLDRFRRGQVAVLVATDVAARGIDVDDISHVINVDLPEEAETYVHRIGRTGRAGRAGEALSFCAADEVAQLRAVQRAIGNAIPVDDDHGYHAAPIAQAAVLSGKSSGAARQPKSTGGGQGRGQRRPDRHKPAQHQRQTRATPRAHTADQMRHEAAERLG